MSVLRALWRKRRWAYGAYMLVAVLRIPARTGFRLRSPWCDWRVTAENIGLSMTKTPHMMLFGIFFLLTAAQFDRLDRRTIAWSLAATVVLGVLIELEEGATRTGNCRMTDVLPDLTGALIAAALTVSLYSLARRAQ